MKQTISIIALSLMTLALSQISGQAAITPLPVLDDQSMAAIRGGFCFNEQCESSPSGVCQPIADSTQALCARVRCSFSQEIVGRIEENTCTMSGGQTTCSKSANFRQCIQVSEMSSCNHGNRLECGLVVVAGCTPDVPDRECVCYTTTPGADCGWTDCVP